MGEVYRAKDTRLDRDVAIKVLPVSVATDTDRLARFEREAKAIAALSHPNVLAIYDTGTHDGHPFVVTELLKGETLREKLAGGALPVRKTVDYGVQIARGLAAAHDKGLVHRDLKPDNIFVADDGQIKILDFGLAKTLSEDTAISDTRTRAITDPGTVLGTVGYMAPEQVRGLPIDARADLFALGAVLYEMLAGRRAFQRDTSAETMTAILKEDPPELNGTRAEISPAIDRIIRHCLEKNPQERFQTARDVAFALGAMSSSDVRTASGAIAAASGGGRWFTRERVLWSAVSLALAAVAVWLVLAKPDAGPVLPPVRAAVLLPQGELMMQGVASRRFAVSPDGKMLAFVATSNRHGETLFLESLADGQIRHVEDTDGAFGPFWSPDSKFVAVRAKERLLKIDALTARAAQIGTTRGSGAWGADDVIVLAETGGGGGSLSSSLRMQSVTGGEAKDALPQAADPSAGFAFPAFLPDGRTFIFGYRRSTVGASWGVYTSRVGSGKMTEVTSVVLGGVQVGPFIVASGHLLFARDRTIIAQPFDVATGQTTGGAVDIAGPVDASLFGGAAFSVSQNGVLVFQPAASLGGLTRMQWFDRSGKPLAQLSDDADYSNLEMSPDGSKLAVSITDPAVHTRDIWVVDLARGIRSRFTFDPSDERSAAWSADGKSLIYTSKGLDLYTKSIGAGVEQPVVTDHVSKDPRGVSAAGGLVYRATGRGTGNDIWVKLGDSAPKPFIVTPFDENYATISPDGQWMAYSSDETGRYEVYVTAFPSGEGKWQISSGGASLPRWRKDGKEMFYLSSDLQMYAVKVAAAGRTFTAGAPEKLFQTTAVTAPGSSYDVTADGKRFLINTTIPTGAPPSLVVVTNWPALIKKTP